jgi:hypothetical protein
MVPVDLEAIRALEIRRSERMMEFVRLTRRFVESGDFDVRKQARRILLEVEIIDNQIIAAMKGLL